MKYIVLCLLLLAGIVVFWPAEQAPSVTAAPAKPVTSAAAIAQVPPPAAVAALNQSSAESFQQQIQYPPYAIPIGSHNDYLLSPNQYQAITIEDDAGVSWQLSFSQYRYAYPAPVQVQLIIAGAANAKPLHWELRDVATERLLESGDLAAVEQKVSWQIAGQQDWPAELRLHVSDGAGSGVVASFSYIQPVGSVTGVGTMRIEQTDLLIPVLLDVSEPGLYKLQAVLQQQLEQSQPLAFLQNEAMLARGQQQILLKAHHSVLPDGVLELMLSHLQLQKASGHPAELTRFGRDSPAPIALGSIDSSALLKTPYEPEAHELQRMQLLQRLSQ